jgi:hypothetical protein
MTGTWIALLVSVLVVGGVLRRVKRPPTVAPPVEEDRTDPWTL